MKAKYIYTLLILAFSVQANAQQQFNNTNFILNRYYYNPAEAGSRNVHVANMSYRNQWGGFEEAPVTFLANVNGSVKNKGKHGYGVTLSSDRTGLVQNTAVIGNYAYQMKLTDSLKLGLGIQAGYMQYRVRLYDAQLADQGDQVLTGNIFSGNAIDMNTGFFLYSSKFFVMGSIQHSLGNTVKFTTYNQNLAFHYNFAAGYNFIFKKKKIVIQPSFLVKYVKPVDPQISGMIKATFKEKFFIGGLYRSDDAAGLIIGTTFRERLTISYGYDFTMFGLRNYQSGSHEVALSFVLTKKKPNLDKEDEDLNKSILENNQQKIDEK